MHRKRRIYPADGSSGSQAASTKKDTSLLPGIFTLYCQHGKIGIDYLIMNVIVLTREESFLFQEFVTEFKL